MSARPQRAATVKSRAAFATIVPGARVVAPPRQTAAEKRAVQIARWTRVLRWLAVVWELVERSRRFYLLRPVPRTFRVESSLFDVSSSNIAGSG